MRVTIPVTCVTDPQEFRNFPSVAVPSKGPRAAWVRAAMVATLLHGPPHPYTGGRLKVEAEGALMYVNPYAALAGNGSWLKANFHVHAVPDGTGGQWTAQQLERRRLMKPAWEGAPVRGPLNDVSRVVALYKDAGYDVLTIADQSSLMDTRELGEKLGIVTINGIENIEHDGILCIGIRELIKGEPQEVIDECARQGGFSIICHPNLLPAPGLPRLLSKDLTRSLRGYDGIEILTPAVFKGLMGSGLATDLWDELLTAGKLVWGFGNDDFHWFWEMDRAWNFVFAGSRGLGDIKAAVRRGSSYVSTGLVLKQVAFDGAELRVGATLPGGPPPKNSLRVRRGGRRCVGGERR